MGKIPLSSFLSIERNVKKDSLIHRFIDLFRYNGKIDPIVLTLCLVINGIVLANAILHYPKVGYDVVENLNYIQVLPDRLPSLPIPVNFFRRRFLFFGIPLRCHLRTTRPGCSPGL